MALHSEYVSDESKRIRVVRGDDGSLIRVFIHQDWYNNFKRLYDYAEWLAAGVEISEIPDRLQSCFDWLSTFTVEAGGYGWVFTVAVIGWVIHLVKEKISLGKFIYESVGYGQDYGGSYSEGVKIAELPVEG